MSARKDAASNNRRGNKAARPRQPTAAEARAEFEANREKNKLARETALAEAFADGVPGHWIVVASWVSTLVFAILTLVTVISPGTFKVPYFAASIALFLAGSSLFVVDLFLAAGRSRDDLMGIGGLFLLIGCAPRRVQINLWSALGAQIVIAALGAATHPFTTLAFGTLVPVAGLSLCGLWGVLHGHFPAQKPLTISAPDDPIRTSTGSKHDPGSKRPGRAR